MPNEVKNSPCQTRKKDNHSEAQHSEITLHGVFESRFESRSNLDFIGVVWRNTFTKINIATQAITAVRRRFTFSTGFVMAAIIAECQNNCRFHFAHFALINK